MELKQLAITADDYGPHSFINKGILQAVEQNLITAVSVLTNEYIEKTDSTIFYNLREEVETLINTINHRPDKTIVKNIGIGVHLTLTSGNPLCKDRALVHYKLINDEVMTRFQDANEFVFDARQSHLDAIQKEIEAQIYALKHILDEHDLLIDHISCHQGIIPLYGVYNDCLVKALNNIYPKDEYSPSQKPTIRNPLTVGKQKYWKKLFPNSKMISEGKRRAYRMLDDNRNPIKIGKIFLSTLNKRIENRIKKYKTNQFSVPDLFFDNYYKKASIDELNRVFKHLPGKNKNQTGELVVHLGDINESDTHLEYHGIANNYFTGRKKELEVLQKFNLHEIAKQKGIDLVPLKEIQNH